MKVSIFKNPTQSWRDLAKKFKYKSYVHKVLKRVVFLHTIKYQNAVWKERRKVFRVQKSCTNYCFKKINASLWTKLTSKRISLKFPDSNFTINSKVKMSKTSLNTFRLRNLLLSTSSGKHFVVVSVAFHSSHSRL